MPNIEINNNNNHNNNEYSYFAYQKKKRCAGGEKKSHVQAFYKAIENIWHFASSNFVNHFLHVLSLEEFKSFVLILICLVFLP